MYPPMMMLNSVLGQKMLNYRITHMEAAKERAIDGGYNGAR